MSNLRYTCHPSDATGEDVLAELALDVNWTRKRDSNALWRKLNPALWEQTQNPWAVLQTVSGRNLKRITSDPGFRATLDEIVRSRSADNEFLSDYDMFLTQHMVSGVDLWINTPRRPWEASGTSGMKVLANGGLNLSETDGWWAEAYTPDVGWAIGDGREHGEDPAWDATEAEAVYALLEQHVVPEFYDRDNAGIPARWVARVRGSMARPTPEYSAHRAVREYTDQHYVRAAAAYNARAGQGGRLGAEVSAWQQKIASGWKDISFGPLSVQTGTGVMRFEVPVHLGHTDPGAVRVELFASGRNGEGPGRKAMERGALISPGVFQYAASVDGSPDANRAASDYTARVIPWNPNASVPLEADQILWQK